uniref:Muscular LMNA interacting protein n=1 Tax=Sciurus vulgaris TaxID=55149 RepID=A0A8D2B7S9_SCIVU
MEFEKDEKRSLLNKNLEEKLTSNSNDYLTFNPESQEERNQGTLTYPSETSGKNIQGSILKTNQPQGMQQSDLFKAEYVFIVDSDGEDEVTSRKSEQGPPGGMGNTAARPKSLAISSSLVSDVVRPKIRGTDVKASSHPEISHGMTSQQKLGQTSTTLPKAAGRETKYANLSSPSSTVSESQLTKPGVIRPVPVKSKILLKKEEEVYEPNPFSKYLEDNSDLFSEQQ